MTPVCNQDPISFHSNNLNQPLSNVCLCVWLAGLCLHTNPVRDPMSLTIPITPERPFLHHVDHNLLFYLLKNTRLRQKWGLWSIYKSYDSSRLNTFNRKIYFKGLVLECLTQYLSHLIFNMFIHLQIYEYSQMCGCLCDLQTHYITNKGV